MTKIKKSDGKNKKKQTQISIRLTQGEKRKLGDMAVKNGLSLSECIRALLFKDDEKRKNRKMVNPCVVILCQDILNIIEEKYRCEDNGVLEEKVEGLWKLLSNS